MRHVDLLTEGETGISEAYGPASFHITWLMRNLPSWLLTAGLKGKLARWRSQSKAVVEVPFEDWQNVLVGHDPHIQVAIKALMLHNRNKALLSPQC